MIEYTQKDMDRFNRKIYEVTEEDIKRFESKIFEVTEGDHVGCHETTYAKNNNGYSVFTIKREVINVHRLIYQIWHPDEDITNLSICHRCDNPSCVNPEHLFSGTDQENMTDKVNKGRQARGSKIVNSKLIECNIIEIINQKTWIHITKDFNMVKVKSLLDNNKGSKHPNSVFNDDQVRDIRLRRINGESSFNLANFYHVSYDTIRKIVNGKTYQDVV